MLNFDGCFKIVSICNDVAVVALERPGDHLTVNSERCL